MSPAQKMITAAVQHDVMEDSRPTTVEQDERSSTEPDVQSGLSLEDDEDASMVESLVLHLVSEHGTISALHMDEQDAQRRHQDLHSRPDSTHPLNDLRFRPKRILATLKLASKMHEDVQRLVAPTVPVQSLRT